MKYWEHYSKNSLPPDSTPDGRLLYASTLFSSSPLFILLITDSTPFTWTVTFVVLIRFAVNPSLRLIGVILLLTSIVFCFSSPNWTFIFTFSALILRTPFGLLIVALYSLTSSFPSPSTLIVTGTLFILSNSSWSPYIVIE